MKTSNIVTITSDKENLEVSGNCSFFISVTLMNTYLLCGVYVAGINKNIRLT